MLSPNDIAPKGKAASIWSFDSGYGSNTLEDDDHCQVFCEEASPTCQAFSPSSPQPIGLGLGGFWNPHIEDQLRVTRSVSPIEPEPLQLSVFTVTPDPSTDFILPVLSPSPDDCVTCQLWDITNPGENLKCDDCSKKYIVTPQSLHSEPKIAVPRLDIPQEQQSTRTHRKIRATRCSACELSIIIDPAQSPSCTTCNPDPNLLSPISPSRSPKVTRSCAKRPPKLPAHALRCLHTWLRENRNNPYPDAETKRALAQEGHITERQVNTWFTNARARRLSSAIDASNHSEDEGNDEPGMASMSSTPIFSHGTPFGSSTPSELGGSIVSPFTATSHNQATSAVSRRGKKKDYGRMKAVSPIDDQLSPVPASATAPAEKESETWQCTFCHLHIAPKSWRRHEDTQHRPQKRTWTCLLHGPRLTMPSRSNTSTVCAFCMAENPSEEHFRRSHRIAECLQKCEADRTFLRPDHLRQHVKNFHKTNLYDAVRDSWRRDNASKDDIQNWTCGFCNQMLRTWDIRETHIAGHFKDGLTIADWKEKEQILPDPAAEATKRRRNSTDDFSNVFTKLTRTLTGRSTRHVEQRNQHSGRFANAFAPLPPPPPPAAPLAAGPSVPVSTSATPLLPDMVFDSFMAEVCSNFVDSYNPAPISPSNHFTSHNAGTMASFREEVEDADLDTLTNAFLNVNSIDFQSPWDQQPQE